MTGFAVHYDVSELGNVAQVFQQLALDDRHALLDDIGQTVVGQTRWRFENEEAPDGTKWIPSQRALATGGTTLQLSGLLRDTVVYELLDSAVLIGSNRVYAAIHQWGGIATDYVALDARTYLGFNDDNLAEIGNLALDYYGAFFP